MDNINPIGELMQSTMDNVKNMLKVDTVVGEPIYTPDGITLVPISRISVGYDLKRALKFLPVQKFHLYVAAQNMFTFTKYSGMDPEVGYGNGQSWVTGIDNGYYPSSRPWQVGVNITF